MFIQIIQFQKISSTATVVESSTIWRNVFTPHSVWLVMCSMYGSQFVPPLCIACDGVLCSLHDEVVAQRALDRRLTSELKRFKSRITSLTRDLADVREHDLQVTEQSREAQDNLATTLADSEKNASLLAEYHDLYELQRKRLEDQVAQLTQERELWQQASYNLAHKVAEDTGLRTVRRLQLCEKAWVKLAGHFAITLSNRDTQQVGSSPCLVAGGSLIHCLNFKL